MIDVLTLVFCSLYALFLLWCLVHWKNIPVLNSQPANKLKVAVIVPVRNEEANIIHLLQSLAAQNYSPFEIIIADDHSADRTVALTEDWIHEHGVNARCISGSGHS